MEERELFFRHLAQTTPTPLAFPVARAEGWKLFDTSGKSFLDLVSGISVANVGHKHPRVMEAIRAQLDRYLHVMVYGEFVESPQVRYARLLATQLPESLDTVFFTNSGSEAVEGGMKLAKRYTGRTEIIAFHNAYHGSTQGALSLIGNENWRRAYRPLLPGIRHLEYNSMEALDSITSSTACVVAETVQGEAGIIAGNEQWLQALRSRCDETGALLVLDEIQSGFGRTGKLWAFQHSGIQPDILLLGKALGGGLPLGAFISRGDIMHSLTENPPLGHITTFGGHPVCCAAGMAALEVLLDEKLVEEVKQKEQLFRELLVHPQIREIRSSGLWLAVEFSNSEESKQVIDKCLENGVFVDWFLFAPQCIRVSPPLTIDEASIRRSCDVMLKECDRLKSE
ncbi:MAG TPA: aspartate aminotransferase family protein [Chitinophagaceae bacterium]|nr:aspartate aminotransferase family protein [Chitinophagaceae bacterium]